MVKERLNSSFATVPNLTSAFLEKKKTLLFIVNLARVDVCYIYGIDGVTNKKNLFFPPLLK